MYFQANAMHHLICGHAPYHHGILSADPVSLPTAGLFNCRNGHFSPIYLIITGSESKNPHEVCKLPYYYDNFTRVDFVLCVWFFVYGKILVFKKPSRTKPHCATRVCGFLKHDLGAFSISGLLYFFRKKKRTTSYQRWFSRLVNLPCYQEYIQFRLHTCLLKFQRKQSSPLVKENNTWNHIQYLWFLHRRDIWIHRQITFYRHRL